MWDTWEMQELWKEVQRQWTREISRMNHLEYAQRLRQLNLYSVYDRLLRADIIKCWKVFHCEVDVGLCDLFLVPQVWACGGIHINSLVQEVRLIQRDFSTFELLIYGMVSLQR